MKNILKTLFYCWHRFEVVAITSDWIICQCDKCSKVKLKENI